MLHSSKDTSRHPLILRSRHTAGIRGIRYCHGYGAADPPFSISSRAESNSTSSAIDYMWDQHFMIYSHQYFLKFVAKSHLATSLTRMSHVMTNDPLQGI